MDWLSQNWSWIALAAGGFFLMTRMGGMGGGCCGMGHSMSQSRDNGGSSPPGPEAGSGTAFDPVSGKLVPSTGAISSVHQGHAYYFESRENRDTFESDPKKYLAGSTVVGQAIGAGSASTDRPQRRHGCG